MMPKKTNQWEYMVVAYDRDDRVIGREGANTLSDARAVRDYWSAYYRDCGNDVDCRRVGITTGDGKEVIE